MSRPLLDFLDYHVSRIQVEPETSFNEELPGRAQIQTSFAVARDPEQAQRFRLTLSLKTFKGAEDENLPYVVELTVVGDFRSAIVIPSEGVPGQVVTNALALLYGVARGIVGQLTADGANNRFTLPTVSFALLVNTAIGKTGSHVIADGELDPALERQKDVQDRPKRRATSKPLPRSSAGARMHSDVKQTIDLVTKFHGVLLSLEEFDNTEVRPRVDVFVDLSKFEECVIGTYLRALANVRTLRLLKSAGNVQAIAMIARALFELAVDAHLLRVIPDAAERVMAFTRAEKLIAARKMAAARGGASHIHQAFIDREGDVIEKEWQKFWPNQKRPRHWSGLVLRARTALLEAPFAAMYARHYQELSWHVHAGLTGVANLDADVFPLLVGTSYEVAIESYRLILRAVIDYLKLREQDPIIERKLEFARLLPFAGGPGEVEQLRLELLGF